MAEKLGQQSKKFEAQNSDIIKTSFLADVIQELQNSGVKDCMLLRQVSPHWTMLSLHQLMVQLLDSDDKSAENFRLMTQELLQQSDLQAIASETLDQCKSAMWSELRYGRITASKLHETAQCQTGDGTLAKKLLGAKTLKDNKFLRRGRDLEPLVVNELQKILRTKIHKTGLVLNHKYPLFGASPDGITDNFIVEVKSPWSAKTRITYYDESGAKLKHKLQVLLQLLICEKQFGYFCVANEDFETSKKIHIIKVNRDDAFVLGYMKKAETFWDKHIYPKLLQSALNSRE